MFGLFVAFQWKKQAKRTKQVALAVGFVERNRQARESTSWGASRGFPQRRPKRFSVWTCGSMNLPAKCHPEAQARPESFFLVSFSPPSDTNYSMLRMNGIRQCRRLLDRLPPATASAPPPDVLPPLFLLPSARPPSVEAPPCRPRPDPYARSRPTPADSCRRLAARARPRQLNSTSNYLVPADSRCPLGGYAYTKESSSLLWQVAALCLTPVLQVDGGNLEMGYTLIGKEWYNFVLLPHIFAAIGARN